MKMIWEELTASFKITWLEVVDFRRTHLGGPEQAAKALTYRHHQRQYQEHARAYSQGSDAFLARCQPVASPVLSANHSFPPLGSHHHVGLPPAPPYLYANGCCANNYPPCGPYPYMPYAQAVKPNANGYYYANGYPSPAILPGYYSVPTGPLIDLETHNAGYDAVDRPGRPEFVNNDLYKPKDVKEAKPILDRDTDKEESQFEDWDYVYRNLESQGYSKDLGERGDVLSPNSKLRDGRRVKETNLDEALNNLHLSDRPLKMNEAVKRLEQEKKPPEPEKPVTPTSSYENLNEGLKRPVPKTSKASNYARTKSLPRERDPSGDKQQNSKTLDARRPKAEEKGSWQCGACTYLNESARDICDMCSKSRVVAAEQPMEIGGAECAKCTLVNPKNLRVCEACGASLKGSPTYI